MNDENLIWESYTKSLQNEAPVADIGRMGDWEDPRKRKYDDSSIKLIKRDSYIEQLKSSFAKNIEVDFNLYFAKSKKASQYVEYGDVSKDKLQSLIDDIDLSSVIQNSKDTNITVIFTNNVAAEKIPLTPWMIAHRIGHVLRRSKDPDLANEWRYFIREYTKAMRDCFNIIDPINDNKKATLKVLNSLGTFRSAKLKQIKRPFEFVYEVFAQYLTQGYIEFNVLGQDNGCDSYLNDVMTSCFDMMLSRAQGKIFIM